MGNFYVNLSVKCADPDGLERAFASVTDKGFVIPAGEWVVICTELLDTQDPEMVQAYGVPLSERLDGTVVAVSNHDDDVLTIEVFSRGQRTGHYTSSPGYFEEAISEDDGPTFLAMDGFLALGQDLTEDTIIANLSPEDGFALAFSAHQAAAKLFDLPPLSVGIGYRYITRGEFALPPGTRVFGGAELPSTAD